MKGSLDILKQAQNWTWWWWLTREGCPLEVKSGSLWCAAAEVQQPLERAYFCLKRFLWKRLRQFSYKSRCTDSSSGNVGDALSDGLNSQAFVSFANTKWFLTQESLSERVISPLFSPGRLIFSDFIRRNICTLTEIQSPRQTLQIEGGVRSHSRTLSTGSHTPAMSPYWTLNSSSLH